MSNDNERESYDHRQGYAKGYSWGFWTGAIVSGLSVAGLLYLIGIGIIPS